MHQRNIENIRNGTCETKERRKKSISTLDLNKSGLFHQIHWPKMYDTLPLGINKNGTKKETRTKK
jgi:hypothetical protein